MPTLDGVNVSLADRLTRLIFMSRGAITIVSAFRPPEEQARLWNQALQKYGSAQAAAKWVAPPGKSNHGRGLAVDIGGDLKLAHKLAPQFGLVFPMDYEPWHIELADTRSDPLTPAEAYTSPAVKKRKNRLADVLASVANTFLKSTKVPVSESMLEWIDSDEARNAGLHVGGSRSRSFEERHNRLRAEGIGDAAQITVSKATPAPAEAHVVNPAPAAPAPGMTEGPIPDPAAEAEALAASVSAPGASQVLDVPVVSSNSSPGEVGSPTPGVVEAAEVPIWGKVAGEEHGTNEAAPPPGEPPAGGAGSGVAAGASGGGWGDFARATLQGLGAPVTQDNVDFMLNWFRHEQPPNKPNGSYNPLNMQNSNTHQFSYGSFAEGVNATVNNLLHQGSYGSLVAALQQGDARGAVVALVNSPWAESRYDPNWQQHSLQMRAAAGAARLMADMENTAANRGMYEAGRLL